MSYDWTIPPQWQELGGDWRVRIGSGVLLPSNQQSIMVEHRFPALVDGWTGYEYLRAYKRGAWQNVSMAFLKDFGDDPFIGEMIFMVMDRHFRPWLYPRVPPFPQFELFPRWTRFRRSKWIRWIRRHH